MHSLRAFAMGLALLLLLLPFDACIYAPLALGVHRDDSEGEPFVVSLRYGLWMTRSRGYGT